MEDRQSPSEAVRSTRADRASARAARSSCDGPSWVFVAGAGRSGTTLLGVLAARATGGFNCGELRTLWTRLERGGSCECGAGLADCAIWSEVAARVRRTFGRQLDQATVNLADPRSRRRSATFHIPDPTALDVAIRAETERAIEAMTGAAVLVDTSKDSFSLKAAAQRQRRLVVIHLVRDPRGVAFSRGRAKPLPAQAGVTIPRTPAWRTSLGWMRDHYFIERLARSFRQQGVELSYSQLHYERLADDPEAALAVVLDGLGADGLEVDGLGADRRGHGVIGNSALYENKPVVVDRRWEQDMSRRDRLVTTALTAPLLGRLGYPLRGSSSARPS